MGLIANTSLARSPLHAAGLDSLRQGVQSILCENTANDLTCTSEFPPKSFTCKGVYIDEAAFQQSMTNVLPLCSGAAQP